MPKALRFILSTVLPVLLVFFVAMSSFAQTPSATDPNQAGSEPTYLINDYAVNDNPSLWTNPDFDATTINGKPGLRIDGTVRDVTVTFENLDAGKDYYICTLSSIDACSKLSAGLKVTADSNGKIIAKVCGAGPDALKGSLSAGSGSLGKECNSSKDYFHEGHTYNLSLYEDAKTTAQVLDADFFIRHSYPLIKMAPTNGTAFKSTNPISVSLWGRRPGVDSDNNYQLILEGTNNNYKREVCFNAKQGSGDTVGVDTQGIDKDAQKVVPEHIFNGTGWSVPARSSAQADTRSFGTGSGDVGGTGKGSFVLKVNERISETSQKIRNIALLGKGNTCEGGFTYMYIYFTIDSKEPNGIKITKVIYDPNNSDRNDLEDQADDANAGDPPCAPGALDKINKNCSAVNTAIGNIETTPEGFINSMFKFILMLAGFGGVLILIYSGYLLMRSQGDKEKVAAARETITSAILGILFIVLSIVILEIIGVDILRIPGFTR